LKLHLILAEELAAVMPGDASTSHGVTLSTQEEGTRLRKALTESFARMDAIAVTTCACGHVGLPICTCELAGPLSPIVGSTAVVGLITDDRVFIANCGDSRAVLGHGGRAYALSCDHKVYVSPQSFYWLKYIFDSTLFVFNYECNRCQFVFVG
jgi:protein phosphatase 2C